MLSGPFSPWPSFTQEEADAVQHVLLSNEVNYWSGNECRQFECEFAGFAETDYAVAVANGTLALELAMRGLGIGEGDEVIVTSRSFIASASSIVTVGATPIFADVEQDSQNISPETVRAAISAQTRAVICVHLAGWPCDMDGINALAEEHQLFVIEDCSQAHGARYKGRSVGSLGDVGCWSFCQDKIMTTGGEGGMVTTNSASFWSRMWSYKDHGKSFEAVYKREHPPGFRWVHESFGTNWRMTEMQAAIGRIQLKRMPHWHQQRRANCEAIWNAARALPGLYAPELPDEIEHAGYKCYVFVQPERLADGWDRDLIQKTIRACDVPCIVGSCSEIYLERNFQQARLAPAEPLPVARQLGETSLMFLCHPTLTDAEITKTCEVMQSVMNRATA